MNKLDLSSVPKNIKPSPVLVGLSDELKDPKCFKKIEKKLFDLVKSDHKHKTASAYVKCEECQTKYKKRKRAIRDLGFRDTQQYMEWKKIMTIITNKKNFQIR